MTRKQSSLRAYGAQKSAVVGGESTADVAIVQAGGGIGGSEKAREVTAGCGGGSEIRFFFLFFPASMVPINIRCVRCTKKKKKKKGHNAESVARSGMVVGGGWEKMLAMRERWSERAKALALYRPQRGEF